MNIALILSGGKGSRIGTDIPKQYIDIRGKPIISYCLETFSRHILIDRIQIVADKQWRNRITERFVSDKPLAFSEPGETRQLSIYCGLHDIKEYASENDTVIIHDAARPLVTTTMITECLNAAAAHDGALPVLPMKDTVYFSETGISVTSLLPREKLFAGQAPEAFRFGKYLAANEALLTDKIAQINGSTEPAILAGMDIALIKGDEKNFKITTISDLQRFEEMMRNSK